MKKEKKVAIPAIAYHQVLSEGMALCRRDPDAPEKSGQIYLPEFIRQMDYLAAHRFNAVTHDELYQWLIGRTALPPKPIVIDFDDHSMISYKNALPVMQERGLRATMFVISGLADGDPSIDSDMWSVARMRWRELEKLLEAGWEIGAHTRTHLYFNTIPVGPASDARIMWELVRGQLDIEKNLGVTARHFTYPSRSWSERAEMLVKQVYDSARLFQTFGRAGYLTNDIDPYRLPTMNINYLLPFGDFVCLVEGRQPEREYYPEYMEKREGGKTGKR